MDWPYIRANRSPTWRDALTSWVVVGSAATAAVVLWALLWPLVFAMFLYDDRNNLDDDLRWRE